MAHLGVTDKLGHLYGTESPAYKEGMRQVDAAIREFYAKVMTDDATFIVTADHGNDIYGSHGGGGDVYQNVPIVMSGRGIRRGKDFRMDSRAMPAVLAGLLGTRVPGDIQVAIPAEVFAMADSTRAAIVAANAAQLQRVARARAVELPAALAADLQRIDETARAGHAEEAVSLASKTLPAVQTALDRYAPPSTARLLWGVALFCGVLVVAVEILWPALGGRALQHAGLGIVLALLAVVMLVPARSVPLLALALMVEVGLLLASLKRMHLARALFGLVAIVGVIVLSSIRFWFMPQIKAAVARLSTTMLAVLALSGGASMGLVIVLWCRRDIHRWLADTAPFFITLVLFAVALLVPLSPIPIFLAAAALLALRSAGTSWLSLALITPGLLAFALLTEHIGFARTGEDPTARYALAMIAGGLVAAALMIRAGDGRRRLALAWALLLPIWPFGHLKFDAVSAGTAVAAAAVSVSAAAAAAAAYSRKVRAWWAYAPFIGTLAYHWRPTHELFWIALATHLAALVANALSPSAPAVRKSVLASVAISGLMLMSRVVDAPSVIVVALGIFFVTQIEIRNLPRSAVIILGAALLVYGRYAFVDLFSHAPSIDCTLKCLDEASGFLGFDDVRWTQAAALVGLKTLLASVLVFSLIWSNPALEELEQPVFVAALLLVTTFVAQAALEAGLSFGVDGSRLGTSLGHVAFHTMELCALGVGMVGYKLMLARRRADVPVPLTSVAPVKSGAFPAQLVAASASSAAASRRTSSPTQPSIRS